MTNVIAEFVSTSYEGDAPPAALRVVFSGDRIREPVEVVFGWVSGETSITWRLVAQEIELPERVDVDVSVIEGPAVEPIEPVCSGFRELCFERVT